MKKKTAFLFLALFFAAFIALSCTPQGNDKADRAGKENAARQESGEEASGEKTGVMVGKKAPDFELQSLDGETVALGDFKGKTLVLTFWETWCPVCRQENPYINELAEKFESSDIAIVTVDLMQRDTPRIIREYMGSQNFDFPVLLDREGSVGYEYMIRWIPTTYIIDGEGTIRYENFGPLEEAKFEEILKKISAGRG